jgi:cation diffusion facilitator family transporter
VALATIALKTGAWWVSGSVSLLSDALESLVNLAGAMFALAMVTVAAQPPDDDHPYGHHKAEYFSSGFEGVLIFAAALAIIWAAVQRLLQPAAAGAVGLGLVLSVISSVLNGALAWAMLRKARSTARWRWKPTRATSSPTSGPRPAWWSACWRCMATGWLWLDPVIAIAVALNILREAARWSGARPTG